MLRGNEVSYIRWLRELGIRDTALVGGKTASLGEMYQNLRQKNIPIPNGFGIVAAAYWEFLEHNHLKPTIAAEISKAGEQGASAWMKAGENIRKAMLNAELPPAVEKQILAAYAQLVEGTADRSVAIRSSATAEDLPEASFAGQQESFLNVRTEAMLLSSCKQCFASLFTDRAISYRNDMGFDHFSIALSICVQVMVRSDLASSGVMFSIDTESGFRHAVLINASFGLGENIVQGAVNPDEFYVFKPTLSAGLRPILRKRLGSKESKLVYDEGGSKMLRNVPVPAAERKLFSLSDDDILRLARWACDIEEHYSRVRDVYTPMDMEWAKDGLTGELWILQARPETVQSQKKPSEITIDLLKEKGRVLLEGRSVGAKIGQGRVRVIRDVGQLGELQEGEVLVTDKTDPDWEPSMKKARAIVTNRGGRTCHAAIVSRELGLPAIVGTENATESLQTGEDVTVSCAEGEVGRVYAGILAFERNFIDMTRLQQRPRTKLMMNLADPDQAFQLASIPNDGVGLARIEFIIAHHIKVHPMALIHPEKVKDVSARREIERLTEGYAQKSDYFVEQLAEGIAMIAAAFYPQDVIVRFSDFKTNEYAHLIGGQAFEPEEENPMIGFRGASRYYHENYKEAFGLECLALRKVREQMGLRHVKLMVPFCRTLDEGRKVLQAMSEYGLRRGEGGLEVYVMCEVPSNVILAREFAAIFDGFSIGSNDLTQLTLGVDRDSEILASTFDERNPAVKALVSEVIRKAHDARVKVGICGQAPSDYPDFAAFLVKEGIDSLSLNPDSLVKTTLLVQDIERDKGPGDGRF